jgi:ABC-type phosphate transport system, periplasmic component
MVSRLVVLGIVVAIAIVSAATYLLVYGGLGTHGAGAGLINPAKLSVTIKAGGSTWIQPQMEVWIRSFSSMYPGISITYDSIGSGAGVTRLLQGVYDIGASDVPMPTQLYENATKIYG